ncbi:MAG: AAA family ATPase, partial [Chloroflexi bacterium]|nr:AAA family ATPase [Chloroflexota bacterium]
MATSTERRLRVAPRQLRCACDLRALKFTTTNDLEPLEGTVGQDRAVLALDFGLSIEAEGFHVFVSGPPGTGRSTELHTQLERIAATRPAPRDWCYVFNFKDPARPRALSLAPGRGHELSHEIEDLIAGLRRDVPRAFESDEYAQRRDQVGREVQARREQFLATLEQEAKARSLAVNATPMGISSVPLVDGKPITKEQYDLLTDEHKKEIQEHTQELDSIISQMLPQFRRLDRGAQQLLAELDKQVMKIIAAPRLEELKRDYAGEPAVVEYLDALGADVVEHLDDFRALDDQQQSPLQMLAPQVPRDGVFNRYQVNVIVTHDPEGHAPIVIEDNPSYYHMFGRIDYRASFGSMMTDHTMIKPGALHRANGGYLVV